MIKPVLHAEVADIAEQARPADGTVEDEYDAQCARCKQAIRPGWLYLTAFRRGHATTAEDSAVLIHVPGECPMPGERIPRS